MKKINQEWQALRDQGYSTIKIGQMVGKCSSHIGRYTVKPADFLEKRRKLYDEGKVELEFAKTSKNLAEFNKNRVKKAPILSQSRKPSRSLLTNGKLQKRSTKAKPRQHARM